LGFTISGFILFWGGTRRFQLEVIPIAREVIMDNIEDGLIITDHQGIVIDFNPAVCQITGLKTNHQIQAFLLDGFIDRMRNSGASQLELDGAFPRPHVLIRITPIHGRKGLAGWVVMLTDITDQKEAARELGESKERYERIFREMRDAIFVRNFKGQILDANPAACKMYGYPREELAGKTIHDLMLENTALLITAENIDLGMIFESPDHLLQTMNYRSNGEMFPVELRECPVIISGETVFLVVVRDVTEKVKAESALKSMNETLEHRIRERTEELRLAYDATIEGWAKALELREKETGGHSERTVAKALTLARRLGFGGEQLEHIRRGALLHDIGKMVVPDHILQKPGSLTAEERKIIYEHPIYSMKMLGHIDFLKPAVVIPYYHHEKWDGSGYPEGLKGDEIPLEARLFALVDVWDALCSDRPYRKALTPAQALAIIEKEIGSHFDPEIGPVFLEMLMEEEEEEDA
ncbi:MAG TPA: HD domain-containing phosphohydrolase, partial [Bacillota bacterium]|nr:HD domain-containing phosphohydrolase [Bacillota bacterium]